MIESCQFDVIDECDLKGIFALNVALNAGSSRGSRILDIRVFGTSRHSNAIEKFVKIASDI